MGMNYPDVTPGQPIEFSARWYNDLNRLLKTVNGAGAGAVLGGAGAVSRLKVYNSTKETLRSGWAVAFGNGKIVDDSVPAIKYSTNAKHWGVLTDTLEPGAFGSVIVSGAVTVKLNGNGDYAEPSSDGKTFNASSKGAQILCVDSKNAMVLLGGGVSADTAYNGYFTLKPLAQTEEELEHDIIRVAVCDGQTWSSIGQTSKQSAVYVNNGNVRWVNSKVLSVTKEKPYIMLRYYQETDKVDVVNDISIDNAFLEYDNYIIGEVIFDGNDIQVIQRHGNSVQSSNGAAYMWVSRTFCMVGTQPGE